MNGTCPLATPSPDLELKRAVLQYPPDLFRLLLLLLLLLLRHLEVVDGGEIE